MKFNKYIPYLTIKHNWSTFNCFTLIEDIYKKFLGVNLNIIYNRIGVDKNNISNKWILKYITKKLIDTESFYWQIVPITALREFDLLVFQNSKNNINHFGCYIDSNKFIHVQEDCFCTIELFNQDWRDKLYNCYRYVV